jgi:hypothetical protein
LTVCILLSRRHSCISNQLPHVNPYVSRNQCLVPDSRHPDKAHRCKTPSTAETCVRKKVRQDVSHPLAYESPAISVTAFRGHVRAMETLGRVETIGFMATPNNMKILRLALQRAVKV